MNRRDFIAVGAGSALTASIASGRGLLPNAIASSVLNVPILEKSASMRNQLGRHRFGINYTPSENWWFCWNDWNVDSIKRDLDAIAVLGADHLRIMLAWSLFQPNQKWVSPVMLERFNQLLTLMGARGFDALVTVFTGAVSGAYFLPTFNKPDPALYTDPEIWAAQELLIRSLAQTMKAHDNIIGFDFGNEMNLCWKADLAVGDAWMAKMFALMHSALPGHVHVNGVDHKPWFQPGTFSPRALAAAQLPVTHPYPFFSGALKYGGPMDPPSTHMLAALSALVRSYAGDPQKPVWPGEFNTCIEELSEKQQAAWLETALLSAIESGTNWFSYWDSHDLNPKFKFDSLEYTLGLLTNDGKVKERGQVFKRIAEAYRGKPVALSAQTLPPPPTEHSYDATWKWMLDYLEWKPKSIHG